MAARVCGVDWAGDAWLAVVLEGGRYVESRLATNFSSLWAASEELDLVLVDVPIGLPEDEDSRRRRQAVDSLARQVTDRPSSVFPVPARQAARVADDGGSYETVAERNENAINAGLNRQSYHIAAGIGAVDRVLQTSDRARGIVREAHPEVCFRGLQGRPLQHSKQTAAGVGERLVALEALHANPPALFETVTADLVGRSTTVTTDDVVDALGLAVVAAAPADERHELPTDPPSDPTGLPMEMVYWAPAPLTGD